MSRPSSSYIPNGASPPGTDMHQLVSPQRPSTDSGHDLPYLRSERQNSTDSASRARSPVGGQQPSRPAQPAVRASTMENPASDYKHEPLPRPSRSASGHASPSSPSDFAAPNPGWLASGSRSNSEENHRTQPPSSSISGHSNGNSAVSSQQCSACGQPMTGQFVRALGTVYHLDCFRCKVGCRHTH